MAKRVLTEEAFTHVVNNAHVAGSATYLGEERRRKGLGLDPFVDPAGHGLIRRSLCRFEKSEGCFLLPNGVAIAVETLLDGTGSMGKVNIETALHKLGTTYNLFSGVVLNRYDPQLATAIFGDVEDETVLERSQFEMDQEIARQITLMDLTGIDGRGNSKENPEYGLYGATYLTDADINRYGLKSYHFALSDEAIELWLDPGQLVRIYGNDVFDKAAENGHSLDRNHLPAVPEMVQDLLKRTHAFFFSFQPKYSAAKTTWKECYGRERMVDIPRIELLPFFEAAVIGLTEGVVDLQMLEEFLMGDGVLYAKEPVRGLPGVPRTEGVSQEDIRQIRRAVAHIPIGAQVALPNFNKIPSKGSKFANKRDLWPMNEAEEKVARQKAKPGPAKKGNGKNSDMWL